jgi:hypothetical protein
MSTYIIYFIILLQTDWDVLYQNYATKVYGLLVGDTTWSERHLKVLSELYASTSGQMMETVIWTVIAVRISDLRNYTTVILYSITVVMIQRNEKQCILAHMKPQTALLPYFTIYTARLGNFFA